jgi:spore protease
MNAYERSDLACEIAENGKPLCHGAEWRSREAAGFSISELIITTKEAAQSLDKPCGHYLTVECGRIDRLTASDRRALSHLLAGELRGTVKRLTHKAIDANLSVFVAGLGNADLTPDAIGPQTMRRLTATRHLRQYEGELYRAVGCSSLSTLAPGVLGQTGIETSELLRGAVNATHPDVIIVIDALTARSCDRLCATVQLSDTGIEPGSGVGNHRRAITYKSMGVPVIALGVPTVVNSATLVWDALQEAGIENEDPRLQSVLEKGKSFFVSPKESDLICESIAQLFARAIGLAFTEGLVDVE